MEQPQTHSVLGWLFDFIVLFIFGSLDWKGSCTRMLILFQSEGKDVERDILFGLLNVLRADITRQEFQSVEQ